MVQTLSQIKTMLADRGLRPRYRFGQNFLHDHHKLRQILDAAAIRPGDLVLEVGPGTGALTERLLDAGAAVVAVEIDRDLAALLRDRLGPDSSRWRLVGADAMAGKHALNPDVAQAIGDFAAANPAPALPVRNPQSDIPFTLIANLPYNIASPLLATLALDWPGMRQAVVMVQREVADRITAAPGGKDFGPLTITLQAAFEAQRITTLAPQCFWPRPKIDSAVIRLTRRPMPLARDPHRLARFAQRIFSQRRKQIGTILGRSTALPQGVEPTMRPEQLSIRQIAALAESAPSP